MRTDQRLARESFRHSAEWQRSEDGAPLTPQIDRRLKGGVSEDGRYLVHSLSGGERNHYFANTGDGGFKDRSAVSGLDSSADARGFALFDYDRDGRQDVAVVNANEPLFDLYRNSIGDAGNVVAVRFVGSAGRLGGEGKAPRDGYGALAIAELDDGTVIKREHRCGEGFASQNSATMLIGIGEHERVRGLSVRWPSGRRSAAGAVAAGKLVTVREAGEATVDDYLRPPVANASRGGPGQVFGLAASSETGAELRVFTTTATWCASCLEHLPRVNAMVAAVGGEGVEFVAVPIDPGDDAEAIARYAAKWKPAYRILDPLSAEQREGVMAFFRDATGAAVVPLPSSVVTDRAGRAVALFEGVPSVSDLRRLLALARR